MFAANINIDRRRILHSSASPGVHLERKSHLVTFDQFTDIDLFLMWDILGRNTKDWNVRNPSKFYRAIGER
ncbi:hypothetical protein ACU4GD_20645 [Cupriavidus basilensis]